MIVGLATFALMLVASPALAQEEECMEPVIQGPEVATPGFGVTNVTLGAPVRIIYSTGFFTDGGFVGDPAGLFTVRVRDTEEEVPGRVDVILDTLVFTPDAPYRPNTVYQGDALGTGGPPFRPTFTTGDRFDTGPPEFGEIEDVRAFEVDPSCDAPDGGYRIDVTFQPATDDGPGGDIEYLLYLSRGPEVEAPELRARARNITPAGVIMAFIIDPSEAVSPICVAVHAVDGVGHVDDDGEPRCEDPIQGNFFEPICSVSAPGSEGAGSIAFAIMVAALCLFRRSKRRPR